MRRGPCPVGLMVATLALALGEASGQVTLSRVEGARITVRRDEARILFPPETASTWWWTSGPSYSWEANLMGAEGRVILRIVAGIRAEDSSRTYRSLDSLIQASQLHMCVENSMCRPGRMEKTVSGKSPVIVIRDSATIDRLFRLSPDAIRISTRTPVGGTWGEFRIEYADPRLPLPDSAFLARHAATKQALSDAPVSTRRTIAVVGRPYESQNLWAVVGETLTVELRETSDSQSQRQSKAFDALWSLGDSSIVAITPSISTVSKVAMRLVTRRPGTTLVRATPTSDSASTGRRNGGRVVWASLVVTRPIARIALVTTDTAWSAGGMGRFFVTATDVTGELVAGVPASIEFLHTSGGHSFSSTLSSLSARSAMGTGLMQAGPMMIIARMGKLSDTLRITVRPRRPPP
jgi:hypothetical protein